MKPPPSRIDLLIEFDKAPLDTLFNQKTVAAVLDCSEAKMERDRWAGTGIPFIKIGHFARYRKSSILEHMDRFKPVNSTAETSAHG